MIQWYMNEFTFVNNSLLLELFWGQAQFELQKRMEIVAFKKIVDDPQWISQYV